MSGSGSSRVLRVQAPAKRTSRIADLDASRTPRTRKCPLRRSRACPIPPGPRPCGSAEPLRPRAPDRRQRRAVPRKRPCTSHRSRAGRSLGRSCLVEVCEHGGDEHADSNQSEERCREDPPVSRSQWSVGSAVVDVLHRGEPAVPGARVGVNGPTATPPPASTTSWAPTLPRVRSDAFALELFIGSTPRCFDVGPRLPASRPCSSHASIMAATPSVSVSSTAGSSSHRYARRARIATDRACPRCRSRS